MQVPLVWLPESSTQPGSTDAGKRLEPGSSETRRASVPREPGWLAAVEHAGPNTQRGK
jgi:hypothetical protein